MKAVERVAWNIRRLRVARGISQEALAFDAKIDRTYVSRVERHEENPTVKVLERVAAVLETDIAELLKEPDADDRRPRKLRSGRKPGQKSLPKLA